MKANVSRGYLEYSDERGSYRIPLGRRTRKCLAVLDRREGEYVRSLEMDLFTGFVYYSVDNETSGGLSYYYDMSSKKVGHYFIHRYLRTAKNHGFTASPQELEIFEKLPCDNWVEEMEKLPGWKDAIENRVENLLLPGREVVRIRGDESETDATVAAGKAAADAEGAAAASADDSMMKKTEIASVTFMEIPAAFPTLKREFSFHFAKAGDRTLVQYRNDNVGNEFFGENEEFDRFLSDREKAWIERLTAGVAADPMAGATGKAAGEAADFCTDEEADRLLDLLAGEDLRMEEVRVEYKDGGQTSLKTETQEQKRRAQILKAALRGLMRREVELV